MTLGDLLSRLQRADPGRPLVTFYGHDAEGEVLERTELSVVTYANWVAKTASLLCDELDLERGDTIAVELGTHWLTTVALGAAWSAGLVVVEARDDALPDAVVCGPAGLERWGARSDDLTVVASSLLPLGRRFAEPVPDGVHDLGVEVWSQPDAFVALDPPTDDDAATSQHRHADLFGDAAPASGERVLLLDDPAGPGLGAWTAGLRGGGSIVLVDAAAPGRPWWPARRARIVEQENARG